MTAAMMRVMAAMIAMTMVIVVDDGEHDYPDHGDKEGKVDGDSGG